MKCDKTACWSFEDKVYIFGGFGPPPSNNQFTKLRAMFQFCEDPTTNAGNYVRGWSNQLVCYNIDSNRY